MKGWRGEVLKNGTPIQTKLNYFWGEHGVRDNHEKRNARKKINFCNKG